MAGSQTNGLSQRTPTSQRELVQRDSEGNLHSVRSEQSLGDAPSQNTSTPKRIPRPMTLERFPVHMGWTRRFGFSNTIFSSLKYIQYGFFWYFDNPTVLKNEILSGFTVAIAQIPESVAFSFIANVSPQVGLISTFWMGLITSLLTGRPGTVSGTAGAVAVVARDITDAGGVISQDILLERNEIQPCSDCDTLRVQAYNKRVEYLFATTVISGLIQLVLALGNVGRLVKMIPESVKLGFANGLAIIIATAQFEVFRVPDWQRAFNAVDQDNDGVISRNDTIITLEQNTRLAGEQLRLEAERMFRSANEYGASWPNGNITFEEFTNNENSAIHDAHEEYTKYRSLRDGKTWLMLLLIAMTMPIVHFLPRVSKLIPSSLVAIIICTIFEQLIFRLGSDSETPTIGELASISGNPPQFHVPNVTIDKQFLGLVSPTALTMAGVTLIESFLTMQLVQELLEDPTDPGPLSTQEAFAQGLGNLISGLFNGFGGDAMIGQSTINVTGGSSGRLSTTVAAIAFLIFIIALSSVIELVPMACLTGILFMVVIYTFNWESLRLMAGDILLAARNRFNFSPPDRIPVQESIVICFVTAITVATNLALAVVLGVGLSCCMFAWNKGNKLRVKVTSRRRQCKECKVEGNLLFANTINFKNSFTASTDPDRVVIDMRECAICDFSALNALSSLGARYAAKHKLLTIICAEDSYPLIEQYGKWLSDVDITTDASVMEDLKASTNAGSEATDPSSNLSPMDSAYSLGKIHLHDMSEGSFDDEERENEQPQQRSSTGERPEQHHDEEADAVPASIEMSEAVSEKDRC